MTGWDIYLMLTLSCIIQKYVVLLISDTVEKIIKILFQEKPLEIV